MDKVTVRRLKPAEKASSPPDPAPETKSADAAPVRSGPFGFLGEIADRYGEIRREIDERLERLATPLNEYGYDSFGFSKESAARMNLTNVFFYRYWLRCETRGIEHLPKDGPVLIVANHAGNSMAWDAAMIGAAVFLEAEPPRLARGLGEFYLPSLPFMGEFMGRAGSVVGTPENCAHLFSRGECVMVFPEGARGAIKTYDKAYQLQHFGLGFMRMALEFGVPILPCGVVGSEEGNPGLYDWKWLARLIGAPGVPITPTFPWFGPLGFLPLPVKFRLNFGPLLRLEGAHDADDDEIQPKVDVVKGEIERLIGEGLRARKNWFE